MAIISETQWIGVYSSRAATVMIDARRAGMPL
jgi:hypothetical protein